MPDDRERARRKIFGRALKRLRKELGDMSQPEMARGLKRAGYPEKIRYTTIGNWERGDSKPKNAKDLGEYLVKAFNVSKEQRRYIADSLVFPEFYEQEEPPEYKD